MHNDPRDREQAQPRGLANGGSSGVRRQSEAPTARRAERSVGPSRDFGRLGRLGTSAADQAKAVSRFACPAPYADRCDLSGPTPRLAPTPAMGPVSGCVPKGLPENSPAFQRRVSTTIESVRPQGTVESQHAPQSSLRDEARLSGIPGVETPGYCRAVPPGQQPRRGSTLKVVRGLGRREIHVRSSRLPPHSPNRPARWGSTDLRP